MLQYYILSNIIIAILILLEIQHGIRWCLKEGDDTAFGGILILTIILVTPWIIVSCKTFENFK